MPKRYTLLLALLLPLALLRLLIKSRNNPAYRAHIPERFARHLPAPLPAPLWIHTVSVGEFLAIRPLLNAYLAHHPAHTLWITVTTPTGRAQAERFHKAHPERTRISYLPYDLAPFIRRFYHHVKPRAVVLMETEIWPNLIYQAIKNDISVLLTNARLSARSLRRYRTYTGKYLPPLLAHLRINAQTRDDARRFRHLGAQHICITPSLKYLAPPPSPAAALSFPGKPLILAASTHDGEEAAILDAFNTLRRKHPQAVLCIAPRHPERRAAVAALIRTYGYQPCLRSQGDIPAGSNDVYLIDTLGELSTFFPRADLAFIGGSLIARGGHNLLEPLHARIPVVFGPSTYNFARIARELIHQPFARQIQNSAQLADAIHDLLRVNRSALRQSIDQYLAPYHNLLERHLACIMALSKTKA